MAWRRGRCRARNERRPPEIVDWIRRGCLRAKRSVPKAEAAHAGQLTSPRSRLNIVDPGCVAFRCRESVIEIWVQGGNVASAINKPESKRTFGARIVLSARHTRSAWHGGRGFGFVSGGGLHHRPHQGPLDVYGERPRSGDIPSDHPGITLRPLCGRSRATTARKAGRDYRTQETGTPTRRILRWRRQRDAAAAMLFARSVADLVLVSPGSIPSPPAADQAGTECVQLCRRREVHQLGSGCIVGACFPSCYNRFAPIAGVSDQRGQMSRLVCVSVV